MRREMCTKEIELRHAIRVSNETLKAHPTKNLKPGTLAYRTLQVLRAENVYLKAKLACNLASDSEHRAAEKIYEIARDRFLAIHKLFWNPK